METFTRFGARLEEESARLIRRGVRLRELLKQPRFAPCALEDQVLSFLVLESGVLDARDLAEVRTVCRDRVTVLQGSLPRDRARHPRAGTAGAVRHEEALTTPSRGSRLEQA